MTLPFSLLLITDEEACSRAGRGVVETVVRALGDDAPDVAVLVRDKERGIDHVQRLCAALLPVARRARALLLVHTHARLVARLGLDGVHLTSDGDPREARVALPKGALLGISRHAGDPLDVGADYVTLSPIFPPTSKAGDERPRLNIEGLAAACAKARTPIVALGGIDDRRALRCRDAGARAVAVLGYVMGAHDPKRALEALLHSPLARSELRQL